MANLVFWVFEDESSWFSIRVTLTGGLLISCGFVLELRLSWSPALFQHRSAGWLDLPQLGHYRFSFFGRLSVVAFSFFFPFQFWTFVFRMPWFFAVIAGRPWVNTGGKEAIAVSCCCRGKEAIAVSCCCRGSGHCWDWIVVTILKSIELKFSF